MKLEFVKHWYDEKYDSNQTILEFIAYHVANQESAFSILKRIRETHPDIKIDEDYNNDEVLRSLVEKYL